LPAGSHEKFIFDVLTIVFFVDFVVGQDVEYWKRWAIWRQAASFMTRLVGLINVNKQNQHFDRH
jgi:hypothetical protein